MITWFLVDYGEVLSAPLAADAIVELSALAGLDPDEFLDRYWRPRLDYDLGDSPVEYWSQVLGRDLGDEAALVDRLTLVDVGGWLRLNPKTLEIVSVAAARCGARLALLSNAPEPLAEAIDDAAWSQGMTHRFYSCRLHLAKPDPATFAAVLGRLEADPGAVLFIDDRPENALAADTLGLRTITFTSASALEGEIARATQCR